MDDYYYISSPFNFVCSQLIKQQLGMLPSEQYLNKIWELFTYCCACIRPSATLENYVLNHW